jgi:hypothetical protein
LLGRWVKPTQENMFILFDTLRIQNPADENKNYANRIILFLRFRENILLILLPVPSLTNREICRGGGENERGRSSCHLPSLQCHWWRYERWVFFF